LVLRDWNVVVSVYQEGFRRVLKALRQLAPTERSDYYNVLVMKADDPVAVLTAIEEKTEESTALYDAISRVAPAARCFEFHSAGEFVEKAEQIIAEWSARLAGRAFHVRLHRRGAKYDLGTQDAERLFDDIVLDGTAKAGTPAKVSFSDPDAVIAIDTIDDRAGLALWTREDLARHRLLRPD
jgi:tRNA(Ser,Leu) C12 N-acetylase TAN1